MKILSIDMTKDRGKLFASFRYPAGEVQVRLTPLGLKVAQFAEDYEIVTHNVPDFMELAQLVSALNGVRHFFNRSLFLQYLPYSRADRRFTEGDAYGLETFLQLLGALDFTTVWTFDAHNESISNIIAGKFKVNLVNLKPTDEPVEQIKPCLKRVVDSGMSLHDIALIVPDAGSLHRYDLGKYDTLILEGGKKRSPVTGALKGFTIDPRVKDVKAALIVDDICDGGGTFIGLAEKIRELNPDIKLGLYVSHGIFSKGLAVLDGHFNWVFQSDYSFYFDGDNNLGEKV